MNRVLVALASVALAGVTLTGVAGPAVASSAAESPQVADPTATAPATAATGAWSAALLRQTDDVPALATGVAVGPSGIVAVGGMTCERTRSDDFGRCWGQPWVSRDGTTWEAIEARASGLELGRFRAATSGPEVGIEGVAYGPGGFVAFGWAAAQGSRRVGTGPSGVTPALWRSDDGATWERLPTPKAFLAKGPMVSGAWPLTIAGSGSGYLLGGTLFDTPTPRGAIWASADGRSWTLADPPEAFDIGSYVDTLEIPAAGGIAAIAVASDDTGAGGAIAVGEACPGPARFARPKGDWAKAFQWTPGDCASRVWRSEDGRTWSAEPFRPADGADLAPVPYEAGTIAATGQRTIVGVAPERVLVSDDARTWDVADGIGAHLALASLAGRFYALVSECADAGCQSHDLALWTSADGTSWSRHPSQPSLPVAAQDFVSVDVAPDGDRLVVTAGYFALPYGELTSAGLLSPALAVPADDPTPEPMAD